VFLVAAAFVHVERDAGSKLGRLKLDKCIAGRAPLRTFIIGVRGRGSLFAKQTFGGIGVISAAMPKMPFLAGHLSWLTGPSARARGKQNIFMLLINSLWFVSLLFYQSIIILSLLYRNKDKHGMKFTQPWILIRSASDLILLHKNITC
jgi:hypothetical protein